MKIISLKFGASCLTLRYGKTHLGKLEQFPLVSREAEFLSTGLQSLKFPPTYSFMCRCASDVYTYLSKFVITMHSLK